MTKETKDFIWIVAGCFILAAIPFCIFLKAAYLSSECHAPIVTKKIELGVEE